MSIISSHTFLWNPEKKNYCFDSFVIRALAAQSLFHSLIQLFFLSFVRSFVRGFNCSYLISFVPSLILPFYPSFTDTFFLFFRFFIRSWSYFVISLVRSFVFFLLHLSPTSLLLHSFIYSHIQFPNYLLQFAAILDACSSAVVVWRFSGIAGQKYSFERERK